LDEGRDIQDDHHTHQVTVASRIAIKTVPSISETNSLSEDGGFVLEFMNRKVEEVWQLLIVMHDVKFQRRF
jgi:hypothetical protein